MVNAAEQQLVVVVVVVIVGAVAVAAFCPFCDTLPTCDEDKDTRYFSVGPESMSNVGISNHPSH